MKREIKFRAWDNVAKRWLHDGDSDMLLMDLDGSTYICSTDSCESPVRETRNTPTLSQYTGLKDKNGKEIYEGDICKTYDHDDGILIDVVVFESGSFLFKNDKKLSIEIRGFKTDYINIIGNIYENPELLKA